LVTVKPTEVVAANEAAFMVITPPTPSQVTPVDLLVA
jgi:hypothetical protein